MREAAFIPTIISVWISLTEGSRTIKPLSPEKAPGGPNARKRNCSRLDQDFVRAFFFGNSERDCLFLCSFFINNSEWKGSRDANLKVESSQVLAVEPKKSKVKTAGKS